MSNSSRRGRGQFPDQPVEPTIVGGRPLGKNRGRASVPRGIEVLVKKASVDPAFREVLLHERSAAAGKIGLELSPTEAATLNSVPCAQIEQIIENTTVPDEDRRVFLGTVGAAMLAVLGIVLPACHPLTGIPPDYPKYHGIGPDHPVRPQPIDPDPPPEPRVSNDVKRGTGTVGRVRQGREHLDVALFDQRAKSIEVRVAYECPFDKGILKVSFLDAKGAPATEVTCRPEQCIARKGTGEATFSVQGKGGAITKTLVVGLMNAAEESKKEAEASFAAFLDPPLLEPGEYVDKNYVICRILDHFRVWSS
ncbi:MAG: hypothetical protein AB1473_16570 [Thermodesulfobacteriota bacterium]